jgi:hypothetical protein
VVRRTIEAFFHKSAPEHDLNLLLLDWSKAFDRIDTLALTDALLAFGIGGKFLDAIKCTFKSEFRVLGQRDDPASSSYPQEVGIRQGCPLSPLLFIIMLTWLMAGVDLTLIERGQRADPLLPSDSIFYADDTILLSLNAVDLQTRFNVIQELAAQVGLQLNRTKTVLIVAKVKSKHTDGTACSPPVRNVTPFDITYLDGITRVKVVDSEVYLGSLIGRFVAANIEIKRRLGLGLQRADDLKRLWRGTGISRKRKVELCDSLIGTKIIYAFETLNTTPAEDDKIDAAQLRLYRRALGLAPPGVARLKGLEVINNDELRELVNVKSWSERVKLARVRLLDEVIKSPPGTPIRDVVFDEHGNPKFWPGTNIPGNTQARGTWLRTAQRNEAEIRQIESMLYRGIPVLGWR